MGIFKALGQSLESGRAGRWALALALLWHLARWLGPTLDCRQDLPCETYALVSASMGLYLAAAIGALMAGILGRVGLGGWALSLALGALADQGNWVDGTLWPALASIGFFETISYIWPEARYFPTPQYAPALAGFLGMALCAGRLIFSRGGKLAPALALSLIGAISAASLLGHLAIMKGSFALEKERFALLIKNALSEKSEEAFFQDCEKAGLFCAQSGLEASLKSPKAWDLWFAGKINQPKHPFLSEGRLKIIELGEGEAGTVRKAMLGFNESAGWIAWNHQSYYPALIRHENGLGRAVLWCSWLWWLAIALGALAHPRAKNQEAEKS